MFAAPALDTGDKRLLIVFASAADELHGLSSVDVEIKSQTWGRQVEAAALVEA